jgi:hypothetical protein
MARFSKKKVIAYKIGVLIFSTDLSEAFSIVKRIERDDKKRKIGLHIKYPLFLSDFNDTLSFLTYFRKITKYQMQMLSVGAELFRADRRTDRQT